MKKEILEIMSLVFEIDSKGIPDNAAPGIIENWDSLRHLNLIVNLEDKFDIHFTDEELVSLINIEAIVDIISSKIQKK